MAHQAKRRDLHASRSDGWSQFLVAFVAAIGISSCSNSENKVELRTANVAGDAKGTAKPVIFNTSSADQDAATPVQKKTNGIPETSPRAESSPSPESSPSAESPTNNSSSKIVVSSAAPSPTPAINSGSPVPTESSGQFQIVSPKPRTGGQVTVTWTAADAAKGYQLSLAQDPACAAPITVFSNIQTTSQKLAPLAPGNYFVCISAIGADDEVTSAANSPLSFTVFAGWQPITKVNAPTNWYMAAYVWTGDVLLMVGPDPDKGGVFGYKYDPGTDSWATISTVNQPNFNNAQKTIWTGQQMIVFGGTNPDGTGTPPLGGAYDPKTDKWSAIPGELPGAPGLSEVGFWTGNSVLSWGGATRQQIYNRAPFIQYSNLGEVFDPSTSKWSLMAVPASLPNGASQAIWTGSNMVAYPGGTLPGASYDPATNSWKAIAPNPKANGANGAVVWTGNKMLVCCDNTGAGSIYNPAADTWAPIAVAPIAFTSNDSSGGKSPFVIGSQVIFWGDVASKNNGAIYNIDSDTWQLMPKENAPSSRIMEVRASTGSSVIVWGGNSGDSAGMDLTDGAIFYAAVTPQTVSYAPVPTVPDACTRVYATHLSQTGLYASAAAKTVNSQANLSYTPKYPLWSDGATKARWAYIPQGTTINNSNADEWIFPVGTTLWKEFADANGAIETRMLVKVTSDTTQTTAMAACPAPTGAVAAPLTAGWYVAVFKWRPDYTDADSIPTGADVAVNVALPNTTKYTIPSTQKCVQCHGGSKDFVIGFSSLQAELAGQVSQDLLQVPNNAARPLQGSLTDQNAMGYLHGNCGHCHNANGVMPSLIWRHSGTPMNLGQEPAFITATRKAGTLLWIDFALSAIGGSQAITGIPAPNAPVMPPFGTQVFDNVDTANHLSGVTAIGDWIKLSIVKK